MDRTEAHQVARNELHAVEDGGYPAAAALVDTVNIKSVVGHCGHTYEVELSYQWHDENCDRIMVICRLRATHWFQHEQLQESLILSAEDARQGAAAD